MNDEQLLRYSRHILLDEVGIEGQQAFLDATVLVVGAGGLGAAACLYLASAGIGKLIIADHDHVDLTNLQRQVIHNQSRIGINKAVSATQTIEALNPDVQTQVISQKLTPSELPAVIEQVDLVLDCTDNFRTRHAINHACVQLRKPLVSGAAIRFDGQLNVFDLRDSHAPCYHCLFPESGLNDEVNCATMGVFAPLVGIIGAAQAAEALKLLANAGDSLSGRLLMLNALSMEWHQVSIKKDPGCVVCGLG